ncbi:reversibly glycosylated polypeptide family protein [Tanacetum coccineum]
MATSSSPPLRDDLDIVIPTIRNLDVHEILREGIPTAVSHGLWLNIPDYDAPTQLVKPCERNTRIKTGLPYIWHSKASNPFVNLKKEYKDVMVTWIEAWDELNPKEPKKTSNK